MDNSLFSRIQDSSEYLGFCFEEQEMASLATSADYAEDQLRAIAETLDYFKGKKKEANISTLLRLSRLPLKEPKSFDNFDFDILRGKNTDSIRNLPALSALHAHKNLAFIGPQGVGKTHLAMAYGRECCMNCYKTYFL